MQRVNAVNSGICLEWQGHTGIFHCADKQFNETFGCDNLGYITLDLQPEPAHFTRKQYHFLNTDSAILFASPNDLISSKIHFILTIFHFQLCKNLSRHSSVDQ